MSPRAIAAVDVGSNSIHLTLARVRDGSAIEVLSSHKDAARLAEHLDGRRVLSEDAIARALVTLRRFRELADHHGAAMHATATATIRAARNGGTSCAAAPRRRASPWSCSPAPTRRA